MASELEDCLIQNGQSLSGTSDITALADDRDEEDSRRIVFLTMDMQDLSARLESQRSKAQIIYNENTSRVTRQIDRASRAALLEKLREDLLFEEQECTLEMQAEEADRYR